MTIDELNALTTLTSTDELPVWDAEASGEPTKKITAQNMAASVKSLASLPNTTEMNAAIQQSTATVMGVDIPLTSDPVQLAPGTVQVFSSGGFANYKYVDLYFDIQGGQTAAMRIRPNYAEKRYKLGFFAWNDTDGKLRRVVLNFTTAGRYITDVVVKMSYDSEAFADNSQVLQLVKAVGYMW